MHQVRDFYNSETGTKVQMKICSKLNELLQFQKTLLLGYGAGYLDALTACDLFYAIPQGYEFFRWPKLRPFRTVVVNECKLPFIPAAFDAILSVHLCEFCHNLDKVLNEFARILNSHGKLVVIMFNRYHGEGSQMDKLIKILAEHDSFVISKMFGINDGLQIWPYNFQLNLAGSSQFFLNMFPLISDIIVLLAEKRELASVEYTKMNCEAIC